MRHRSRLIGPLCLAVIATACAAPATAPDPPERADETARVSEASGARRVSLTAATPSRQGPERRARRDEIDRRSLDFVLDAGPGALLQHIELLPVIDRGRGRRFLGFRIGRIFDNSEAVLRYGVRPGDVLHSVNGHRVTTPDHLMRVFQTLRTATHLRVSVLREGRRIDLSWPIVRPADAPRPAPRAAPELSRPTGP